MKAISSYDNNNNKVLNSNPNQILFHAQDFSTDFYIRVKGAKPFLKRG